MITLTCSSCGSACKGTQWWNRDTGYGICGRCALWIGDKLPPKQMELTYGREGEHYVITKTDKGRHLLRLAGFGFTDSFENGRYETYSDGDEERILDTIGEQIIDLHSMTRRTI